MVEIRKRRLDLGIPQSTLAALARVNRPALCQHELGQATLTAEAQQRVERVLSALEQLAASYPVRLDLRYALAVETLLEKRGAFERVGA